MAIGKTPKKQKFGNKQQREFIDAYNRKDKDINKLRKLLNQREYAAVITHARIALEKGITEAYRLSINACIMLKDELTAERLVKLGLKKGISETHLLSLLSRVYLATQNQEKYDKTIELIRKLANKKEEILRRITS